MKFLYKNWFLHNIVSHPLSELLYWLCLPFGKDRAESVCNAVHDFTVPIDFENGRG